MPSGGLPSHSLQKQEQIKGPENTPIARFYGLCCYQSGSEKAMVCGAAFRAWPPAGQRLEIKAGGKSQTGLAPRSGWAAHGSAQAEFGCVLKPNSVSCPKLRLVSHPQRMGTPEMTETAPGSGNQSHARLHVSRPRTKAEPAPRAAASAPPRQPGAPALERNRPNAVAETPMPKRRQSGAGLAAFTSVSALFLRANLRPRKRPYRTVFRAWLLSNQ